MGWSKRVEGPTILVSSLVTRQDPCHKCPIPSRPALPSLVTHYHLLIWNQKSGMSAATHVSTQAGMEMEKSKNSSSSVVISACFKRALPSPVNPSEPFRLNVHSRISHFRASSLLCGVILTAASLVAFNTKNRFSQSMRLRFSRWIIYWSPFSYFFDEGKIAKVSSAAESNVVQSGFYSRGSRPHIRSRVVLPDSKLRVFVPRRLR